MDNSKKYLDLKHNGRDAYEIIDEMMDKYKSSLFTIKKIREIFPNLSLVDAKEIVMIRTTEHNSLCDYQGSLLPDLEEMVKLIKGEKNENKIK